MSSGPEHYTHAEDRAEEVLAAFSVMVPDVDQMIALAQVHATLALAAAVGTLDVGLNEIPGFGRTIGDSMEWRAATSADGTDDE